MRVKHLLGVVYTVRYVRQHYLWGSHKHYGNTPMYFNAVFHGSMNGIFETKICDFFLIYSPNIDCGYLLEPPR